MHTSCAISRMPCTSRRPSPQQKDKRVPAQSEVWNIPSPSLSEKTTGIWLCEKMVARVKRKELYFPHPLFSATYITDSRSRTTRTLSIAGAQRTTLGILGGRWRARSKRPQASSADLCNAGLVRRESVEKAAGSLSPERGHEGRNGTTLDGRASSLNIRHIVS